MKKAFKGKVKINNYDTLKKRLLKNVTKKTKVWLDEGSVNEWIVQILRKKCEILFKQSPVTLFKARKNETEIAGFKACHVRDGVAMVKFLHWLEGAVLKGGITEISASNKLAEFRSQSKIFSGFKLR